MLALKTRLGLAPDRRYVICVARFHPVKDHRTLIAAFAQVAGALGDVDLLLAGDGELRPAIEAQLKDLGIEQSRPVPGRPARRRRSVARVGCLRADVRQ